MTKKHSLEITVPSTEVEKETERVALIIQQQVRLPGFRNGQAPLNLVKTRFAGDIRQDVLESLVPRAFRESVCQEFKIVGTPHISNVHFHVGEPLKFKVEFEVLQD